MIHASQQSIMQLKVCLMYFPLFVGVLCLSLFCYALLCVHFSFAIILKRKRKLVALLLLSYRCIVTINVLWLFLTVPWVGLQHVFVVFPDYTPGLQIRGRKGISAFTFWKSALKIKLKGKNTL